MAHKGPTRSEWSKRELKGSSPGLCEHSATHSAVLLSALESHMIDRKGGKKKDNSFESSGTTDWGVSKGAK